jgi:hypothetical protein
MHLFNMATLFVVLTLVGVEFSVSAFVNPAASRLEPESQLKMRSHSALVLGKVMPVWYSVSTLFLGIQTWLSWHTPGRAILVGYPQFDTTLIGYSLDERLALKRRVKPFRRVLAK